MPTTTTRRVLRNSTTRKEGRNVQRCLHRAIAELHAAAQNVADADVPYDKRVRALRAPQIAAIERLCNQIRTMAKAIDDDIGPVREWAR